jgi:hypothetical protein
MPKALSDDLELKGVKPTRIIIKLVDRFTKVPFGMLENVLVKVEDFIYPTDFLILETHPS